MDLNVFLKLEERYKDFHLNTTFYTAFYGLASALEYVHNCDLGEGEENLTMTGYHHDIRPHNILVRFDTFLLTDFGLAKMNGKDKESASIFKAGGGDYLAPECMDEEFNHQAVGRAADIWSLGGMMVDIASYMELGPRGRSDAEKARLEVGPYPEMTNTWFFANGWLKTGVSSWMSKLERDPSDRTLRTFLKLSRNMLQVPPDARPDASTVRRNASYIALKSLFRAALKGMIGLNQNSSEHGPDSLWYDIWKLSAWGEVIDINGVKLMTTEFMQAMSHGDETERKLQRTLISLVRLVGTKPLAKVQRSETGSVTVESPRSSYVLTRDDISKHVSNLKRDLPSTYQKRIDKRKTELVKQNRVTEVPKMPEEFLQPAGEKKPVRTISNDISRLSVHSSDSLQMQSPISHTRISSEAPGTPNNVIEGKRKASHEPRALDSEAISPANTLFFPSSPITDQTNVATPEPANTTILEDRSVIDQGSRKPSQPSSLRLPKPYIAEPGSEEAHGAILDGTGIFADV